MIKIAGIGHEITAIGIIGSRSLYPEIKLEKHPDVIISGGAKGVDQAAKEFAQTNGIQLIEVLPDYQKHGKSAPIIRNKIIVDLSNEILAYWDGKSRGTAFVIKYARQKGKPVNVINLTAK